MSRKRWWQATKRPWASLVLGLAWTVLAVVQWWLTGPDDGSWRWLSRVGTSGMACCYLAAWAARRSREPTGQPR